MRGLLGLVGLVVVLAIVAVVAKKQLGAVSEIKLPQAAGATAPQVAPDPQASVRDQSQQIQQQIKQSVDAAMQQARPMPEDK
jgi:hypothetical protein